MGRLVQRVAGQQALGLFDGLRQPALNRQAPHQPFQRPDQLAAQPLGLVELPFLEGSAVAQAEAGQEVAPVQRDGLLQRRQAASADLVLAVAVGMALNQKPLELGHVAPQAGNVRQGEGLPLDNQPLLADAGLQAGQRAA